MKNSVVRNSIVKSRWSSHLLGVVLLLLVNQVTQAQIYKCENFMGDINFSDEPCAKGEKGSRIQWLKSSPQKHTPAAVAAERAKKTAQKAKKNNKAYVLVSLLSTTRLELETASLYSSMGDKFTETPELLLSDGLHVDLLNVDKIKLIYLRAKDEVQARFIMFDGYEELKIIKKPYPVIYGEAKIGHFKMSLEDIKQIEFFNSAKLRKKRGGSKKMLDKRLARQKENAQARSTSPGVAKTSAVESTVIELDLSHEVSAKTAAAKTSTKIVTTNKKMALPKQVKVQPRIKTVAAKKANISKAEIVFANDTKLNLQNNSLGSIRDGLKARNQHFILNNQEQIAYQQIKSIRVRPTEDKSRLVVAVALKSGEIKMENMEKPFTRILGKTDRGTFNYSLLEIKSISFQR